MDTSPKGIGRIYRPAGRTIWRYNSGTRPQRGATTPHSLFFSLSTLSRLLSWSTSSFRSLFSSQGVRGCVEQIGWRGWVQRAAQCNAADVPPLNGIVGTPRFFSLLEYSRSKLHPRRSLTSFFIKFHRPALAFSPFFARPLPHRSSLFPFSLFGFYRFPLSRMPVRINELGHGFLLQRDPALGPHRLGYNRFEATAISDMRVQTNRQYSRDYTLFLSFPWQAQ